MTDTRKLLQDSLAAIESLKAKLRAVEAAKHAPVAIVGVDCRYPGGVEDIEALWRLVKNQENAISVIPSERWDVEAYYDPDPKALGKMYTKWGGFLKQRRSGIRYQKR